MDFKPALIVVDMQNDFCPPLGSLAVTAGRDIVPLVNRLLASDKFVVKIATKDWHPQKHISFASNHQAPDNKPFESFIDVHNHVVGKPEETMKQRLWPDHCVQNSKGAELIEELDQGKIDLVVHKGMDERVEMYSAFTDSFGNLTKGTGGVSEDLTSFLHGKGVSHVYNVGLAGDYCVKYTALDAAKAGFVSYVVEDAQRCVDPETWAQVKHEFQEGSVKVVSSSGEEVKRLLE